MPDPAHQTATLRQCVILVGGLGTRLGALTETTPKPILTCGDRPFLAWLLRELSRFGFTEAVLLTGHLSDTLTARVMELAQELPVPMNIVISREPARAGTGGALFHAHDLLDERFLLCNGDSLLDCNLALLLAASARDDDSVIGRILLRALPDASRYGVVTTETLPSGGDRVTGFLERPPGAPDGGATPGDINAGIYVFDRRIHTWLQPVCSLERDVMPALAAAGVLRAQLASGYFIDIGIEADLTRAQTELPAQLHRRALFLDRDGVINVDHGYVGTPERFEFIDGAADAIRMATQAGWHVFIVTNQSGVARGFYDEAAVRHLHAWLAEQIRSQGGTIDDVRYCPYHPEGSQTAYRRASDCRKPAPGMLLDLLRAWEVDPASCVMIGDQPSDMAAAEAAGVAGYRFAGGNLADFVAPLLAQPARQSEAVA